MIRYERPIDQSVIANDMEDYQILKTWNNVIGFVPCMGFKFQILVNRPRIRWIVFVETQSKEKEMSDVLNTDGVSYCI